VSTHVKTTVLAAYESIAEAFTGKNSEHGRGTRVRRTLIFKRKRTRVGSLVPVLETGKKVLTGSEKSFFWKN